jgi:replicative DNA helicase
VIMFIYREELYDKNNEDVKGKAEVIVEKQRNGPTGTITLTFLGEYTRFENYTERDYVSNDEADEA